MTKILVTGMSGLIGGVVYKQLADGYELSALNRRPVDGVPTVQADIADFDAMRPAFDGQDVVIHLAAYQHCGGRCAQDDGPCHHVLDEIMYVVDGEASVLVGDEVTTIPAGGWHLRPHGIVHTFWNVSDKPLRFIDIYPNQNFEDFFPELSALMGDLMSRGVSPVSDDFLRPMRALDEKWGMVAYYDQRQPIVEKYGLR